MAPQLSLTLHHRTCHEVGPEEDAPEMRLERVEDDCGIYACPQCNHKVQVLLIFQRDVAADRAQGQAHAETEMQTLHARALRAARLRLDPENAECRTCGHPAHNHVAGRCRCRGCGCGGWS